MTSRQARRERREAERKARKAELKLAKAAAAEPRSVSQARAEINRANGRGRDASCPAPPAQIRTCGIPAYGSYLG
jgi:hypothetical protein